MAGYRRRRRRNAGDPLASLLVLGIGGFAVYEFWPQIKAFMAAHVPAAGSAPSAAGGSYTSGAGSTPVHGFGPSGLSSAVTPLSQHLPNGAQLAAEWIVARHRQGQDANWADFRSHILALVHVDVGPTPWDGWSDLYDPGVAPRTPTPF